MNALVKYHRRSFAILFFLCLHFIASAQPTANFTATPLSGCSPLVVYFSDGSTGSPTQWKWDLGNGVISTLKNPSATYFNPGTYTIKLTVKNAAGVADSITKLQYITVYANPTLNFSASDTTGCFPLAVQFTDSSNAGSGTIASWQWDFGDGNISSQQNPLHTYAVAGNYTVTLKLTNSFGCIKSFTKTQWINVVNGVTAGFTNNAPTVCAAPFSVQFNNTSTGPGNLTYQWIFGDGNTSTASNPFHTYTSNGNFTVTLIAVSAQGCTDTLQKINLFNIGNHHADFTAPINICTGQNLALNNTSSPTPTGAQWHFGDGTFSSSINPVKNYTTAGTYTIKLVSSFGACTDSITKQITVAAKPQAFFLANETVFCKTPATVQFTSPATAASQLWIFGDGTTSTVNNPTHIYIAEGIYSVTLIVTNASGCSDSLIRNNYIQVKKPVIQINGLPQTGCTPITINPSATVASNQPVQNWLWNFGDGTTSSLPNPTHVYSVAGNYNVTLTITTTGGCTDSLTLVNGVRVGNKPHANFAAVPPEVCNLYPVQFIDSSTGNVDQWLWIFGDGMTSTQQNPLHVYGDIGLYSVTLIVWNNTCPDTLTLNNLVNVLPPVSAFSVQNSCTDKYTKQFIDASFGGTSWLWNFGDGQTSTAQNPSHTYTATGNYLVTLTVSNGVCWNINNLTVKVVDENAALSMNNVACKGSDISFTTPLMNNANIATWQWNFGDGQTSSQPTPLTHIYTNAGAYTVSMTVTDILGCVDTKTDSINIYGPTANFHPDKIAACLSGNNINFIDSSYSDGQHSLMQWIWNYGDGTIFTSASSLPFAHIYTNAGEYTVGLTVKDAYGCKDSISFSPLIIAQPHADFISPDSLSCTGKTINFINQSTGYDLQYDWNFGDGNISSLLNPTHFYNGIGSYNINLAVTDRYGCKDSLTKPAYINISFPNAAFSVSDSFGTCPPLMVHFTNTSTGYSQFTWDFGDGSSSSLLNPSHYYNMPGTFYAKLIVTGPGGCKDTATQKIVVQGPTGNFVYTPLNGCNPLSVNFIATTQNATAFVWDFSDGNTLPSPSSTISHTYTTGEFIPKMILVDAGGCNVAVTGTDTLRVFGVTAGFTTDINSLCNNGNIQFTNTTVANDYITGYQWNFGDGYSSTVATPTHLYNNVGSYTVQLIAITANGCRDTLSLLNTIAVLEKPDVQINGNTEACVPASLTFSGQVNTGNASTITWQWNFGNSNTSTLQNPSAQFYPVDGSYTISSIATAQNGCKDTATKNITIHPLPATNAGADAAICRGGSIQLNASGAVTYVWNNASSLSCTNCISPIASPVDSALYIVTGTNAFGCTKKDSVLIKVHQPFVLNFEQGDTICVGNTVHLAASGADIYSWYPTTGIQNPNSAATTATPQTSTTYHVIAKDNYNCFTDTADVFIKVWPLPTVNAGADQQLVVGDALQLTTTSSNDVITWQWNFESTLSCPTCAATLAKPKQTTTYTVTVKNGGGCKAMDNVTVTVICNNGNLFIPNTFSPNGDGVNDKFFPSGKGINMIKSLRVFNRWGEVVFERTSFNANDASSGWDGKYKGQILPPDVYIYSCDVVCQNNEVLNFKGDITLLR